MIKWGGAVVTALLVVVWVGSGWWYVRFAIPLNGTVGLHSGTCFVDFSDFYSRPDDFDFIAGRYRGGDYYMYWTFQSYPAPKGTAWHAPLWLPTLLSGVATFAAWRLDTLSRRREGALCPTCRYDRSGLAAHAKCPECGQRSG